MNFFFFCFSRSHGLIYRVHTFFYGGIYCANVDPNALLSRENVSVVLQHCEAQTLPSPLRIAIPLLLVAELLEIFFVRIDVPLRGLKAIFA